MSRVRVYILPFSDLTQDYVEDWIEITSDLDINAFSSLTQRLDNKEYDVGIFNFGDCSITLRNEHGRYNKVGDPNTIFGYKRGGTKVRMTFMLQDDPPWCGIAKTGNAKIFLEQTMFTGLLVDETTDEDVINQNIIFKVLGLESIFKETLVPFDTVTVFDLFSETIFNLLNQSKITNLMTLSLANISCGVDLEIDSIASLQNKTVKEGLDQLLMLSNSILYVDRENVIHVSPRVASAEVMWNFYGQASLAGPENIQNLSDIRNGLNRTFNFVRWDQTTLSSEDANSTAKFGVRVKEISSDIILDETKRNTILQSIRDYFGQPKRELELTTIIKNYDIFNAFLLSKVSIDYPSVYFIKEGQTYPVYDSSIYDQAEYPVAEWSLEIDPLIDWMITGRKIDFRNQLITYNLREV